MGKELIYYDISPRIVRAGSETLITIRPLFEHVCFKKDRTYQAALIPAEGSAGQMRWSEPSKLDLVPEAGVLNVPCRFEGEQEYVLVLTQGKNTLAEFRLYALEEDLYTRRPFKGDFHLHTHHSDGIESPAYVAGACRKVGMDFMAITDHHQYAPSLEAMRAFQNIHTDLRIYPGEEVHGPGNPVHILNFGGSFSVNDLFKSEEFLPEVEKIQQIRVEGLANDLDSYPYAACVWSFNKIREAGGLAVSCHPYWFSNHRYDVPQSLITLLFEQQPYDALELIGGYHRHEVESNHLQVSRYQEERARGKRIPIVGVSDSHGCEVDSLFGWYYTIAFAPSSDLPDLIQSIKDLYSVAVEAMPGEAACAFGPFRLVRYAQFIMREIFPAHDQLCAEEGRLMLDFAAGNPQAAAQINSLAGRTKQLYDHWWG